MKQILISLLLILTTLSFGNNLWHEAPEASVIIFESAPPLSKASFVIDNIEFTYRGVHRVLEEGYIIVFKATNMSDSMNFLAYSDIGEAFTKSMLYTPLNQFSNHIRELDFDWVSSSFAPNETLFIGFFIPESPDEIVGINFLNHHYKWDYKEETGTTSNVKEEVSGLKFRGFILGNTTMDDVLEKEGKPAAGRKVSSTMQALFYNDEILGRKCFYMYIFKNGLLFSGMYIFEFKYSEINEMSRVFKKLRKILTEKYGEGTLTIEGYGKNLIKDLDDETTMLYVATGAVEISVLWLFEDQLQGVHLMTDLDENDNTVKISLLYTLIDLSNQGSEDSNKEMF